MSLPHNTLFYGDNLTILRDYIPNVTFHRAEKVNKDEGKQGKLL